MPASPPQYHLCCQSLDRCSYVGPPRGRASGTLPPAARIESRFSLGTSGYGDSRWLGPRKNDSPADPTSWPAHWLPAGAPAFGAADAPAPQRRAPPPVGCAGGGGGRARGKLPTAADPELEAVLGGGGGAPPQQQYRHDRDYPHGTTPRWSKSDPQNREFVRKTR